MSVHRVLILACVLAVLGVSLVLALAVLMAVSLLRPPRMTDGKAVYRLRRLSPGDLGLVFDNVSFVVHDSGGRKLKIAGWWIPCRDSTKTTVLLHGYADAKVGGIAWAPVLHAAGQNILAIDLRAHGESGGVFCTGGFFERHDVDGVIDQLLAQRPAATKRLSLFGVSLGAGIAAAVAAGRADLSAVVLESPFADYRRAIAAHVKLTGLPGGVVLRLAINFAQWISGARFDDVRPTDTIKQIRCPVLAVVGADDFLLDETDVSRLREAVGEGANQLVVFEAAGHLQAMQVDPGRYAELIATFLNRENEAMKFGRTIG